MNALQSAARFAVMLVVIPVVSLINAVKMLFWWVLNIAFALAFCWAVITLAVELRPLFDASFSNIDWAAVNNSWHTLIASWTTN